MSTTSLPHVLRRARISAGRRPSYHAAAIAVVAVMGTLLAACSANVDFAVPVGDPGAVATPDEAWTPNVAPTATATPAPTRQTGFVETVGAALPPFDRSSPDPAVGQAAPVIHAQTFLGRDVTVDPADGTGRVIAFFAHWCSSCQHELAHLSEWLRNNDLPADVEVVAVSTLYRSSFAPKPSDWFEAAGWPELVLRDSPGSHIAGAYGLTSVPLLVVVDGDGTVVHRISAGDISEAEWEAMLDFGAPDELPA